jgi:2-C-methyl-D-erythritol 4-phosphate cytidylyltransferase
VSETVVLIGGSEHVEQVVNRDNSRVAKAPQGYWLDDVLSVEEESIRDGLTNMIDTCTLMRHYGRELSIVDCRADNVKITTPEDFFMFRAVADARENEQLG